MKELSKKLYESLNEADSRIRVYNKYLDKKNWPSWYNPNEVKDVSIKGYMGSSDYTKFIQSAAHSYDVTWLDNVREYHFDCPKFVENLVKRYWEEHIDLEKIPNEVVAGMINEYIETQLSTDIRKKSEIKFQPWFLVPDVLVSDWSTAVIDRGDGYGNEQFAAAIIKKGNGDIYISFSTKEEAELFAKESFWKNRLGNQYAKYKSKIKYLGVNKPENIKELEGHAYHSTISEFGIK